MERPIQMTLETTLQKVREMVDVDIVIGKPVYLTENRVVIPFSKASFGFLSGGGELDSQVLGGKREPDEADELNFIGGGASGVTISPVGFITSDETGVRVIPANFNSPLDRAIENLPRLVQEFMNMKKEKKTKEERGNG